jgi:hypothetical protein
MQCFLSGISTSFKFRQLNRSRNWIEVEGMQKLLGQVYTLYQWTEQHNNAILFLAAGYVHSVTTFRRRSRDARDRCEYELRQAFLPSMMEEESCITQNRIYSSAHSAK